MHTPSCFNAYLIGSLLYALLYNSPSGVTTLWLYSKLSITYITISFIISSSDKSLFIDDAILSKSFDSSIYVS